MTPVTFRGIRGMGEFIQSLLMVCMALCLLLLYREPKAV
jgi:hypothetical protein